MKVGYVRVSTLDQNTARQEVMMQELGVEQVFVDRTSGKNLDRPELKRLLAFVRKGDTVIVESISRWARNTKDFLILMEKLQELEVGFISKKECIDTTSPAGRFMMVVFSALYELERENTLDRQREGIALAKQQGKYKGRKVVEHPEFERYYQYWKSGKYSAVQVMKWLGMSKTTFYRRVKDYEKRE